LHTAVEPGTLVQVRGRPWLLRSLVTHADCCELHLEPAAGHTGVSAGSPVVLLTPFDRPAAHTSSGRLLAVSRRAWMAALRTAILGQREPGTLAAAARASLDVLPHQLEPALAVVRHGARRLLLADAVGLGKTIEAGLVLAELRARSVLDRVLVLAPPGLCDQWCAELSIRFGMDPVVADACWLRSLRPVLPAAINPWSVPGIRVASLDFAKRPEVRRSIEHVPWDAVIVDEAHIAAGDSERRAAAHAFAARARFVLLLTATPHSGDPAAFHALCGIGAVAGGDPLVMFRRDREEAGIFGSRRAHLHYVSGSEAELAVRRRLDEYLRMVWTRRAGPEGRDARLAMIVLLKRSLSGMGPLRRSLMTRLERLGAAPGPTEVQLLLSLESDQDEADATPADVLGAPGLDDPSEERRVLRALVEGAAFAEAHDSKRRALTRLLRRVHEPVIVFTEYRDTLTALQGAVDEETAILHGAMDRFERAAAVNRFNTGGARVLLATDAAGEGLNLQHRCRLVINLELPWNPMRLEQRIGRVDRIGQSRTVHAVNLLASGTAESGLLVRLAKRLDHARRIVGAIEDVLGGGEEGLIAEHLGLAGRFGGAAAGPGSDRRKAVPPAVQRFDLGGAAREVAARLALQRQLLRAAVAGQRTHRTGIALGRSGGILVAAVRHSRLPIASGRSGLLVFFRVRPPAHAGLAPCDELVPVFAAGPCARVSNRQDIRARASDALAALVPRMASAIPPRAGQAAQAGDGFDRDRRLAARARDRRAMQRGLFDRRAEREAEADEAEGSVGSNSVTGGSPRHLAEPVLLLFLTS
jgi:superfamily II DNA or RNA helicase